MSNFMNKLSSFCRKCIDIWATALSADLFVFMTACILLFYTLFFPHFLIILALICLFIWAILF